VIKATRILDEVGNSMTPVGPGALATRLGLPKSTTHDLCSTLVAERYLERLADGTYRLGTRVLELYGLYNRRNSITAEFARVCDELSPAGTVVLAILDGTEVLYVGSRPGSEEVAVHFRIGMRLPATCAASGKAILSTLSETRLRELYGDAPLPRPTERALRTIDELLADFDAARARGYTIDDEETRPGFLGVGAPVFSPAQSAAIAAVGCSVIKTTSNDDAAMLGDQVARIAVKLSERFGDARSLASGGMAEAVPAL
jgi:DNA-binding IclR family transcriptional regulator